MQQRARILQFCCNERPSLYTEQSAHSKPAFCHKKKNRLVWCFSWVSRQLPLVVFKSPSCGSPTHVTSLSHCSNTLGYPFKLCYYLQSRHRGATKYWSHITPVWGVTGPHGLVCIYMSRTSTPLWSFHHFYYWQLTEAFLLFWFQWYKTSD